MSNTYPNAYRAYAYADEFHTPKAFVLSILQRTGNQHDALVFNLEQIKAKANDELMHPVARQFWAESARLLGTHLVKAASAAAMRAKSNYMRKRTDKEAVVLGREVQKRLARNAR